jgi:hypothetical protein
MSALQIITKSRFPTRLRERQTILMAIFNPITFVSNKIDAALNSARQQTTHQGLDPHTREALEILRVDETASNDDIATVLNLSPDVAEPFIKHAKRILLKEQLTRPLPVPQQQTSQVESADTTENGTITTGRWIEGGDVTLPAPVVVRIEQYRQTAEQFEEDKEDRADTLVRWGAKAMAYVLPVTLAFFVAMLVGEQYASLHPKDFWWPKAMYAIAVGIEYALWYTSFAASREFKRMLSDHSRIGTFVGLLFGFIVFSLMSILAQWFVYEHNVDITNPGEMIGVIFRTCSTTGVDTLSLLVLGTLDYRSFQQFLKKQAIIADHVSQLSRKEVETERIKQEEVIRQEKARLDNEREMKRAAFFAEMEQRQIDQMKRSDREERGRW